MKCDNYTQYVIINEYDEDTEKLAKSNGEKLYDSICLLNQKTKEEAINYFNEELEKVSIGIKNGTIEKSKYKTICILAERQTRVNGRKTIIEDVPIIQMSI